MHGMILVTGATGYVGGQLLLPCSTARLTSAPGPRPARTPADGRRRAAATSCPARRPAEALEGVDVAYYLVHSMGRGGGDFAERDRRRRGNFGRGRARAGVRRVVYLGGLGGRRLRAPAQPRGGRRTAAPARPELVYVRAAMVIGPGSASFEMLRHLVERLPVMIAPALARHPDPADRDRRRRGALAALAERDDAPEEVQLGGADVLTYREMIARTPPCSGGARR